MDGERLARIEERQISNTRLMEKFIDSQEKANEAFWATHAKVNSMESRAKGAWWAIVQMGTLTAAVAGAVGWLSAHMRLKMGG